MTAQRPDSVTGCAQCQGPLPRCLATLRPDLSYARLARGRGSPTYGTTYYYRVSAVNSVGEGGLSNESSAKLVTSPSAPLNLKAVPHKSRGIVLTWSAPTSNGGSPITGYRIYRSTSPGTEVFLVAVGTVSTYRDTRNSKGVRYYYVVVAVNAVGQSPLSNESTAIAK